MALRPAQLTMKTRESCTTLCTATIPPADAAFINSRINEHYMHHWFVDGLPAGRNATSHYTIGFALGSREYKLPPELQSGGAVAKGPLLYNHYDMTVLYHSNGKKTKFRVVGVLVVPRRCVSRFLLLLMM